MCRVFDEYYDGLDKELYSFQSQLCNRLDIESTFKEIKNFKALDYKHEKYRKFRLKIRIESVTTIIDKLCMKIR